MDATIFDTSPKEALGFWPLIAAWVSLKKRAYAETGFCGSLGSFFFLPFLLPAIPDTESGVVCFAPPLLAVDGDTDDVGTDWEVMYEGAADEDSDTGVSTSTLLWKRQGKLKEDM